jgi:cytochrome c oxidase cbb3-type subunit 2
MKRPSSFIFLLLGLFLTSWLGLVVIPYVQAGRLTPEIDPDTKDQAPPTFSGLAEQGRAIYAANGCVYCHSQQVRSRADSADIDRGDGARRTVARDYVRDRATYLGDSRLGPDLANVGVRRDKAEWYYEHEYAPESVTPGSNCPPLPFLFDHRKITGQPSADALHPTGEYAPATGYEIVPRHDARALTAYLLSLKRSSYKLPEAPEEAAPE